MRDFSGHTLYETDFIAWAEEQAEALRIATPKISNLGLDLPNLIDEFDSLARQELTRLEDAVRGVLSRLIRAALDTDADRARISLFEINGILREACQRGSPTGLTRLEMDRLWAEAEAALPDYIILVGPGPCPFEASTLLSKDFSLRGALETIRDLL